MTASVIHPAVLERQLQERVRAAREARRPLHRSPRRRRIASLLAGGALAIATASVWASHGSPFIDLTENDSTVTHNSAIFTQGGVGSGTGNFDPYLTLSPGGNVDFEQGYNMCSEPVFGFDDDPLTPEPPVNCPDAQFDEQEGGDRTHELLASSIPVVDVGGTLYREFFLDSNDAGSDPWMSIQVIKLFFDEQPDLTDYDPATETFDNDAGSTATVAWDMDDTGNSTILMNTQGLESGSGVSDISVLIPDSLFPADCNYGSVDCDTFVYFYTEAGDPNLVVGGAHAGKNWNTTAGFEEWRIELLPVVNVDKDVEISLTRTFPWDVQKEADGEPDVINLFAGDTATINWTVTATVGTAVDSGLTVSGSIDILNPTGDGFAIEDGIPAVVTSVEDVLALGANPPQNATVTCPDPYPFTIAAGDTVTCTYTATPASSDDGTNTATVTIETNEEGDTTDYSETETVDFDLASVTEIDECIEVTDDNLTPGDTSDDELLDAQLCEDESPGSFPDSDTVGPFDVADCGQTTVTNTAHTETNDTATLDSDPDSVTVNCYELTVTKNATEQLTRTFPWDVQKEANGEPDVINLFAGDTATINWTVTVTVGSAVDSGHAVSGTITLSNPAPIIADDVSVADSLTGGLNATVDCDAGTEGNQTTVDVPAATIGGPGTATCSYTRSLPDGTNRTNTATATLFGESYTGTAPVNFAEAVITEIDECIEVTDDNLTPGDTSDDELLDAQLCEDESPGSYPDSDTVGPFTVETCGSTSVTNTAHTETNDTATLDSDPDTVTVNCHELTVTKDANTSLERDYDWSILKERIILSGEDDGDGNPLTLTLSVGQIFTATYEITVDVSDSTDANWAVDGTITISNPAPLIADDVDVADQVSGVGAATVDCSGAAGNQTTVSVPAAVLGVPGTATCSYTLALPDGANRTNTATATLFDVDYIGTADVLFDANTDVTEIDECIDVVDDNGTPLNLADDTPLGTVCVDDPLPHTFTNTIDIGPFAVCGPFTFTNTASFVTSNDDNDTDESGSSVYTITIDVPCPEGCSLTQGYWKTHNDTFWGGAPPDDTWFLLGNADGDLLLSEGELETFFLSGGTYFDAMWTAPGGNVYYQLSRQYIAAVLNGLNGAAVPAGVQDAIDDATALFETYTPAQIAALKGKNGKELRSQFVALAGTLASYNEGTFPGGPPHCDEDGTSSGIVLPPLLPLRRRRVG